MEFSDLKNENKKKIGNFKHDVAIKNRAFSKNKLNH